MKTNKRNIAAQRTLIDRKLRDWTQLRSDRVPRSGWIKAVRGALGMTTRQLAKRMGVEQSSVSRLEARESGGSITLERLARVAGAMNCKLIYAIVPNDRYQDLEDIIEERARELARQVVRRTEHSMRLEKQGSNDEELAKEVARVTEQVKSTMDSRLWEMPRESKRA